ncbi:MAG: type II secretion system GspH family protein [Verrucomicrobiales bacterium]|nr:type II secretion system GspH family protein [Verrucomicrobiales bacterium]
MNWQATFPTRRSVREHGVPPSGDGTRGEFKAAGNGNVSPAGAGTSCGSVRGFTLLELLAVIAIVGVLAALLSSALNQTKARAHQIGCLNNLRQLQQAWIFYAEDNDDMLPLNRSMPSALPKAFGWRNTADSWVTGNPKEDTSTQNIENGSLFRYVNSPSIYRCPADDTRVAVKASLRRTRSYSMSAYLNGDEVDVDPRVKVKLSDVQMQPASKIFVFIEEDMTSPWLGSFKVMPVDSTSLAAAASFASVPGAWHNGGCDLSFADGHVEFWRWYASRKAAKSVSPATVRQQLQNVRRLQEAIPKP